MQQTSCFPHFFLPVRDSHPKGHNLEHGISPTPTGSCNPVPARQQVSPLLTAFSGHNHDHCFLPTAASVLQIYATKYPLKPCRRHDPASCMLVFLLQKRYTLYMWCVRKHVHTSDLSQSVPPKIRERPCISETNKRVSDQQLSSIGANFHAC